MIMEQATTSSPEMFERGERLFVRYGDDTYEVPAVCPHLGGPLAQGTLAGPFLRCVWHGATFDIRTGTRLRGPQCADLVVRKAQAE